MAIDKFYQALPAGSDLIERVRADPDLAEWLWCVPFLFRDGAQPGTGDPHEAEMCRLVRASLAHDPTLATRNCDLGRHWDLIHYLLSAARRGEPASGADAACDAAVRGLYGIADQARGTLGHPVRYVPPADVGRIADLLEPLTCADLRARYVPSHMDAAIVYKFLPEAAGDEEFAHLCELFGAFRAFYSAAAQRGEMVIVCTD